MLLSFPGWFIVCPEGFIVFCAGKEKHPTKYFSWWYLWWSFVSSSIQWMCLFLRLGGVPSCPENWCCCQGRGFRCTSLWLSLHSITSVYNIALLNTKGLYVSAYGLYSVPHGSFWCNLCSCSSKLWGACIYGLQNIYWSDSGDLVTISSDNSFYILKYKVRRPYSQCSYSLFY